MGRRNFDRPRYKTAGKTTESISGNDVPREFRTVSRRVRRSKAEDRQEADRALKEWMAKNQLKPISIIPDEDDDGEPPF